MIKKILFGLLFCISQSTQAQQIEVESILKSVLKPKTDKKWQVAKGYSGGLNRSRLEMTDVLLTQLNANGQVIQNGGQAVQDLMQAGDKKTWGYDGGGFYRLQKSSFYIQPEVAFTLRSGYVDIFKAQKLSDLSQTKLSTLSLNAPVMLGFKWGPLRFNGGPVASVLLSPNTNFKELLKQYKEGYVGDPFNRFSINYQAGIGLDFFGMTMDARYFGGLSDITNVQLGTSNQPIIIDQRLGGWNVTFGKKIRVN